MDYFFGVVFIIVLIVFIVQTKDDFIVPVEDDSIVTGKKFSSLFWCKNCGKESSISFLVGTRINRATLGGTSTGSSCLDFETKELRCPICEIGSLY